MVKKIMDGFKKLDEKYMAATLAATVWMLNTGISLTYASALTGGYSGKLSNAKWPWQKFLNSLMEELSGPLPKILGVLGIVGAAVALFAGNGGAGTQKFIMLIFAISIALFAPSFINMLDDSASATMIEDVVDTIDIVKDVIH